MKGLNYKELYLTSAITISILNGLCAQTKEDIRSVIWNQRTEEIVLPEGDPIVLHGRQWKYSVQDEMNSCSRATDQMLLENYSGQPRLESKVKELFATMYPGRHKINTVFLDEQNPFVRADARMLASQLEPYGYTAKVGHGSLQEQQLKGIIDQGGSIKIPIHSRLGYPHRVVVIGYHYDEQGVLVVDIANPSSIIFDDQNEIVCYPRDNGLSKYDVCIDNKPLHNKMSLGSLNTLYRKSMSTMSIPVRRKKNPGYIMIIKNI